MNFHNRLSKTGLAIFLLHGVIEKSHHTVRNYLRKHLEKDYFYQFLLDIKQAGQPLSMDDVVRHCQDQQEFPPYSFALTFDDGFENNYSIAVPILNDLGLPATFYVTTQFIDENSMSWIDRIEACLEITPEAQLSFPWDVNRYELKNTRDKLEFLDYLRSRVKQDKTIDQDELASSICSQCGIDEIQSSSDPLDRKMSWQQVREISENERFIVGGHTHRHANMNFLTHDELETEVLTSIRLLREKADIHPRHYSYPEGLEYCYSDEVIKVLQASGVICSPTAIDGINDVDTGLFHLRRIAVV
jgi:peptidoglycan/xylan/chitin deacetylase (PgdA/CDA1 family)